MKMTNVTGIEFFRFFEAKGPRLHLQGRAEAFYHVDGQGTFQLRTLKYSGSSGVRVVESGYSDNSGNYVFGKENLPVRYLVILRGLY